MHESNVIQRQPPSVEIEGFREVREAWRCPHLSAALSGPGEEMFHLGTVMRLDGETHTLRRNVMGMLLRKNGHQHFRDKWLFPTADASIAQVLAQPSSDGVCRTDLLRWARLVNLRLAAALTGLDAGTTAEGAIELFELMQTVLDGRPKAFTVVMGKFDSSNPKAQSANAARQQIIERFFNPALDRRRTLVTRFEANEIQEADLPNDLITLIARRLDPAWEDIALARREAMFLMVAGINTSSYALVWTLREMFGWLKQHPEDRSRLADQEFLLRCAQEAIRMHPVTYGFPRVAIEDVTLSTGTHIPRGGVGVIRSAKAAMETEFFGADAHEFNPYRKPSGEASRHGYAFGAGEHMCFGMPIVLGSKGINGSLVYLLQTVLRAGVQEDPSAGVPSPSADRGKFPDQELAAYPVVFAQ